jgi:TP901 family phage tail tape measure protein
MGVGSAMLGVAGAAGLGGSLGNLFVTLSANSIGMVKGMKEAEIAVTAGSARILAAAKAASLGVGAALAAIGAAGVVEYGRFQKSMAASTAIMSGLTDDLSKKMEATARTIATTSTSSAKELADAYYFLASAGLTAEQSIAALQSVDEFAIAGQFNLSRATTLLADAQAALGLKVADATKNMENMNRIADVLVKANILANASVEQFSDALTHEAGSAMKAYNIDVEEGVAVLTAMADQGIKAEHAGMSFSRMLRLVSSEAVQNAEAYRHMNVAVFDSEGALRNIADIIGDLEKAMANLSAEEKVAAFETLGFRAHVQGVILPLLGTSQKIREYEAALRSAGGTTKEVAEKQLQNLFDQLTITWHRFEDILLTVGEKLTPVLMMLNASLQDVIGTSGQMNAEHMTWVNSIAPAMVSAIGVIGDAFWGWKVAIKSLQLAHAWFSLKASEAFDWILDKAVKTVVSILKVFNRLQTELMSIPGAAGIVGSGVSTAPVANYLRELQGTVAKGSQDLATVVAENQKELDNLIANGSFSERLIGKFEKISHTAEKEGHKTVQSVRKTVDDIVHQHNHMAQELSKTQASNTINQMYSQAFGEMTHGGGGGHGSGFDPMVRKGLGHGGFGIGGLGIGGMGLGDQTSQQIELYKQQEQVSREHLKTLKDISDSEVKLTEEAEKKKFALVKLYGEQIRQLQMAQAQLALESASNMFGDLAKITEVWAGKQSMAYKAMFAVSKAFAIAEATVKIAQGIANAASMSWPANLAAMASVVAATASIVSNIQSVQLEFAGGKAAGGSVSSGKAYLVGEKGPELFSPAGSGNITPNDMLGGSNVSVVVNNHTDAQAEVRESGSGRDKTIEIIIARTKNSIASDIREGRGDVNGSMQSSFGLRRSGR